MDVAEVRVEAIPQLMVGKENVPAVKKAHPKRERQLRLPLARVKNIMKTDPEVQLISSDASFMIAKATELFIETMSRSLAANVGQTKRKTVLIRDLEKTISSATNLCFLDGMLNN